MSRPVYPPLANRRPDIRLLEIEEALKRFLFWDERIALKREYNELWDALEKEAEAA